MRGYGNREHVIRSGGGRFGVRITNDANLPAGTTALDVRWNDVVT